MKGTLYVIGMDPSSWLHLVVMALAVWRITHLFMYEEGPWFTMRRLRSAFGVKHDEYGPLAYPSGSVFECFLCLSLWVSLVVVGVSAIVVWWIWIPFALSCLAIWGERWYNTKRP